MRILFLILLGALLSPLGCHRWSAMRLDNLRDERVGQIEQHLGVDGDPTTTDTARDKALPSFPDSPSP